MVTFDTDGKHTIYQSYMMRYVHLSSLGQVPNDHDEGSYLPVAIIKFTTALVAGSTARAGGYRSHEEGPSG